MTSNFIEFLYLFGHFVSLTSVLRCSEILLIVCELRQEKISKMRKRKMMKHCCGMREAQ